MNEWHEVKTVEDLPKNNGSYIVCTCKKGWFYLRDEALPVPTKTHSVCCASYNVDEKMWVCNDHTYNALVIDSDCTYVAYWMEMPTPPNGFKNNVEMLDRKEQ